MSLPDLRAGVAIVNILCIWFNVDKLRELCPEQMAAYEHSIGVTGKEQEKEKSR